MKVAGYHFNTGRIDEAAELVARYHYSGVVPAAVVLVGTLHEDGGLWGEDGPAVAACLFSIPPTRWSEDVWELSRLVRRDDARPALSALVSATVRQAKKAGAGLLVSFADWTHNHHGGIYQACSWNFHGKRARSVDGVSVNGVFVPGRSAVSLYGTRSAEKLKPSLGDVVNHYDEGKFLYWKAANKAGKNAAERLELQSLPYPKPRRTPCP